MTKLKRKLKNLPASRQKPDRPYPLPGEAGLEIIRLIMDNKTNEAYDLLYETYIGTPGDWATIEILEDDGETLFFVADRGPFKVYGMGRDVILDMKDATEKAMRGALDADEPEPEQGQDAPGEGES